MESKSKINIEELDSRIIKYKLHDQKNGAILYYTLDLDKYQLSIQGETCGSYKWYETPERESFLELMVRCDSGYLLNKLFERVFSLSQSIKSTKQYIKENGLFWKIKDENDCLKQISAIYTDHPESFIGQVVEILKDYDIDYDIYELYSCLEKDYEYWDKKAISYFCNNIKPKLRKVIQKLSK
jgi:hypothetical protein